MTVGELQNLTSGFAWERYFSGIGVPTITSLNVVSPDFFVAMQKLIVENSVNDWKSYLRWQLLHKQAGFLPTAFGNEDFSFFSAKLTGAKEQRPRWKRCVSAT